MQDSSYILGQVMARGGMAEVYRGLYIGQDGFRRLVAIKRVLPQYASNPEFAEMFRDEAHIGQRLQHANVVKVECYSVLEQCPSIIMEFVDGSDLRSILAEIERSKELRRIPIPMALYIVAEAARGLHYAHTRRDDMTGRPLDIVHRDISPQNILVSYNGEVKVTDFGIASADRDFKNTETKAGIVKGKYSYMSPEQISAKKVDARTDVFALSIVLWEMLAMRRLFSADSEVEVIDLVKNCRITANLRELNKQVSPDLESTVLRGLTKDPNRRFSSMDELERSIRSILSKEFPNFTVGDLGNLMKQALSAKHDASQLEIKRLLSDTNLRSSGKAAPSLELEISGQDLIHNANLTVSRLPAAAQGAQANPAHSSVGVAALHAPKPSSASSIRRDGRSRSGDKKKPRSFLKPNYILAAAVALTLFGGAFLRLQSKSARDAFSATLRAVPSIVRVKVNGRTLNSGRFVRTPARLKLEEGANIIEISRPGYRSDTLTIDTRRTEQRVLPVANLVPNAAFSTIRFMLIGVDPAHINVNDGFATGNLTLTQPLLEIKDVAEGGSVDVVVTEKGQPPYRCRLAMSRIKSEKPLVVGIDPTRNRCDLSNLKEQGEL